MEPNVWITAPDIARISIGGGTFLNQGVMVAAAQLVEIGEHCMLANGCFVTDGNHRFDDPGMPVTWQGFTSKGPTRIGDNVWCGANVVVSFANRKPICNPRCKNPQAIQSGINCHRCSTKPCRSWDQETGKPWSHWVGVARKMGVASQRDLSPYTFERTATNGSSTRIPSTKRAGGQV